MIALIVTEEYLIICETEKGKALKFEGRHFLTKNIFLQCKHRQILHTSFAKAQLLERICVKDCKPVLNEPEEEAISISEMVKSHHAVIIPLEKFLKLFASESKKNREELATQEKEKEETIQQASEAVIPREDLDLLITKVPEFKTAIMRSATN